MDSSKYRIGSVSVLEIDAIPPTDPGARYGGLNPQTSVLPVGYKREPDCRAWETETVFEQDIPIRLRDGVVIRADVFRPANSSTVPAIVHYSPYGKSGTGKLATIIRVACNCHMLSEITKPYHML
jgi:hypothetical protein